MRSVSNYYKDKIRSGDTRNFLVKIDLTLADDTEITVTEHDILVDSFKILSASSGDSSFDIGSAIIGKCEFSLINFDDRYMQFDFFNATAVVWVKLEGDSEYHRIGFYTVDEPTYAGSIIQIEMLDNMWLFDVPLADVGISVPITLANAVSAVCSHCGVTLATNTFHGYSFQLTALPDQDMNCREFLQYVAMIGCNFCVIDSQGQLRLRWYSTPSISEDSLDGGSFLTSTTPYSDGDDADGGNFTDYSSGDDYDGGSFVGEDIPYFTRLFTRNLVTDEITITGVKIVIEDTEYSIGTTGYVLVLENPLVTASNVNNVLNLIWDVLEGFKMRGFKVTALPDIAPEVGDCVAVSYKGNMIYTYLSSFEFTPSACTAALGCEAPTRNLQRRYSKSVQTAVEQAKKKTNEIISEYDNLVQLMNSIAVNAIGGYEDYEDLTTGGRVWYVSNRPITKVNNVCSFVAGSTVFKKTGEGFYVSTNGGQTYVNGYDSQTGLLVVNILSAIGVVADWIKTGLITDTLGYNYWNLDTGELRMTAGAKVRKTDPNYSGAYVPTNSNSPASDWTTDELKRANLGKTFNNTSTSPATTYIYSATEYPETSHPYSSSETAYYKFETGLTAPIKITFDSQSKTESASYDWIDLYYTQSGTTYTRRIGGNIGGMEIIIPTSDFYLYWRTDSSVTDWGWRIDSIISASGSPEGFSASSLPSYAWTVVGGKYAWKEATLDNYVNGVAGSIVTDDMTQEEIFNALTNGGQEQGIYLNNGKVYLNGQYVMADSLSANDIATGRMRADMIQGGTLTLGGTDDYNGNLIVLGNNTTLDGEEDVTTASHDYGYYDFGSLGKYVVSASLSGLQNDYTMVFEVGLTTNGGLDYHIIFREEFTFNKPSVVFTLPVVLDINTTDRDTYYHIGVHEKTWTKTFNYEYSYSPVSVLLDKTGIDATKGTIGDLTISGGTLYANSTYYLTNSKTIRCRRYSAGNNYYAVSPFVPNTLYLSSSFRITLTYTVADVTTYSSGSDPVFQLRQRSSGGSTVLETANLTKSAGTYTITFSTYISSTSTDKYDVSLYVPSYSTIKCDITVIAFINNARVISLSDTGVRGIFTGSSFGIGNFDSVTSPSINSGDLEITEDGFARESDDDNIRLAFNKNEILARESSTRHTSIFNSRPSLNVYKSASNYIRLEGYTSSLLKVYTSSDDYIDIRTDTPTLNIQKSSTSLIDITHGKILVKKSSSSYIKLNTEPIIEANYSSTDFIHISDTEATIQIDSSNYCTLKNSSSTTAISGKIGGTTKSVAWSSSDGRYKEDVEPLDTELSKNFIDSTETKQFKYINEEGKHYGMIAQDVRVLLDDLGETDARLEYCVDEKDEENPRNIAYHEYIPHLINYVKDLRAELDAVKTELKELKEGK